MKIQGALTARDLFEARMTTTLAKPLAVLFMSWISLSLVLNFCGNSQPIFWTKIVVDLVFVLLVSLRFFRALCPPKSERLREEENLLASREIEITAEGLTISSSFAPLQATWQEASKYWLTKKALLLFFPGAPYHVLPLRWFNVEQLAEVKAILKNSGVKRDLFSVPSAS